MNKQPGHWHIIRITRIYPPDYRMEWQRVEGAENNGLTHEQADQRLNVLRGQDDKKFRYIAAHKYLLMEYGLFSEQESRS